MLQKTAVSKAKFRKNLKNNIWLYVFIAPTMLWFIIFHYIPIGGAVIAFKRYTGVQSIWDSPWVGLKWFESFFSSQYAEVIIRNTLVLSLYALCTFPLPIILALMMNELRSQKYKKVVQTVMYAPHFVSMVVLVSMLALFFHPQYGFINHIITALGGESKNFMADPGAFRHLYVWSGVWQNTGWSTIIYLAALSGVSPELHEAARIDGASRLQIVLHINLPAIAPTVITMLILRFVQVMDLGFEKIYLLQNSLNLDASQVIATYVYEMGVRSGQFSYSSAIGLFNTVINVILLLIVNQVSRRVADISLW